MTRDPTEISHLLSAHRRGEAGAMDRLFPLVYDELHELARRQRRRRHPGETLDTTALLHEAYLKLVDQSRPGWQDRNHFMAVAAVVMRHLLVDQARKKTAQKRGGKEDPVPLLEDVHLGDGAVARAEEILAIHEALEALAELSPRLVTLVELRFFAGLSVEEAAAAMDLSERTIKRDWRKARAFLHSTLAMDGDGDGRE